MFVAKNDKKRVEMETNALKKKCVFQKTSTRMIRRGVTEY